MKQKIINVEGKVVGPYASHAVEVNGFIFVSGILPWDVVTNELITDDIKAATSLVLKQMEEVLETAGSSMDKVVKTTIFLRDMEDWSDMNEAYQTFFPENPPSRSTVEVQKIALDLPIEIEAIAFR